MAPCSRVPEMKAIRVAYWLQRLIYVTGTVSSESVFPVPEKKEAAGMPWHD